MNEEESSKIYAFRARKTPYAQIVYSAQLRQRGELPEFSDLLFVPANREAVDQFLMHNHQYLNENIERLLELELER